MASEVAARAVKAMTNHSERGRVGSLFMAGGAKRRERSGQPGLAKGSCLFSSVRVRVAKDDRPLVDFVIFGVVPVLVRALQFGEWQAPFGDQF